MFGSDIKKLHSTVQTGENEYFFTVIFHDSFRDLFICIRNADLQREREIFSIFQFTH